MLLWPNSPSHQPLSMAVCCEYNCWQTLPKISSCWSLASFCWSLSVKTLPGLPIKEDEAQLLSEAQDSGKLSLFSRTGCLVLLCPELTILLCPELTTLTVSVPLLAQTSSGPQGKSYFSHL